MAYPPQPRPDGPDTYTAYSAYSYLTPGEDFPVFDLSPEFGRVPAYEAGLTAGQSERAARLLRDSLVSSARTIASLVPDARLVVFERSGHSPQTEEAAKFQEVMRDFLGEVLG